MTGKSTPGNWPFPDDATGVYYRIHGERDGTELAFQLKDKSWRRATADELAVYYEHHPGSIQEEAVEQESATN